MCLGLGVSGFQRFRVEGLGVSAFWVLAFRGLGSWVPLKGL